MGLIDRIRSYLNEEDIEENQEQDLQAEASLKKEGEVSVENADEKKEPGRVAAFFTKLFTKKKEEDEEEAKETEKPVAKKKNGRSNANPELYKKLEGGASESERKNATDFCEQLVDITYYEQDMEREYQVVTGYLTDIQRIEELPTTIKNDLTDVSRKIEMLDSSKQTYLKSENLLPMDRYNAIAALEKDIPDTIKKLIDMEQRDTLLKSDMSHLEGEKEDLKYMHKEYTEGVSRARGIMITILVLFLVVMSILLMVSLMTKKSVTVACLGIALFAMLSFATAYMKYLGLQSDIKENDAKLKRAVSLLNKVKVKFINNTNTLDYIYEKYGVNSSKELEYEWDQYNTMVRDSIRYSQASNDFRVYCDELVDKLKKIGLSDPFVWVKQTRALIDHREMVEITHSLNVRRQKIREKLATCDKIKANARIALRAAIDVNPGLESFISDQLASYNIKLDESK